MKIIIRCPCGGQTVPAWWWRATWESQRKYNAKTFAVQGKAKMRARQLFLVVVLDQTAASV
jgi:hypothetical protein